MATLRNNFIPVGVLLLNLLLIGGIIKLFYNSPLYSHSLCIHPLAESTLVASGITLVIHISAIVVWRKAWLRISLASLCVILLTGALALWLGSYSYSPLQFSDGLYPTLQGFLVTRQGRINEPVDSGDIILVQSGVPLGISVSMDEPQMACHWNSLNHGDLDDSDGCNIIYLAPAADYDILSVRISSACNIPPVRGQIKVSILP